MSPRENRLALADGLFLSALLGIADAPAGDKQEEMARVLKAFEDWQSCRKAIEAEWMR